MTALPHLARWLEQEQGFVPWDRIPPGAAAPAKPAGLDFAAVKDHWGSVMTVGLARADGLRPDELARRAEDFHGLVQAMHAHAGAIAVHAPVGGSTEVALGSFGVLLLVYDGGAPPGAAAQARVLKRGGLRAKEWSLPWVVDVPARKVRKHAGLPLGGVKPAAGDVERALRGLFG